MKKFFKCLIAFILCSIVLVCTFATCVMANDPESETEPEETSSVANDPEPETESEETSNVVKEPKPVSVDNPTKTINQGSVPYIPTQVMVNYDDGSKKRVNVKWKPISKYSYQFAKDFYIYGTAEGTELEVKCLIKVTPTRDLGHAIIRDDTYQRDTITVNNNETYTIPEEMAKKIYDTLSYYKKTYGIRASFTTISLKDYTTVSYNADDEFSPASVLKAPYSLYMYKEINNKRFTLDTTMAYQECYWEISCGTIKYSKPGTLWSLKNILHQTIDISDNTGYYMLRAMGGCEGYKEMLNSLGCTTPDPYRAWANVTPHDLSVLWNEIYNFSFTCSEGELFMDTLVNAQYNFIKDGLGTYTKVAHKSGFNAKGYHDSAIIFGDSNPNAEFATNDYIMTIMTTTYNQSINNQLLTSLAKGLDEIMKDLTLVQNK